MTTEQKARAYDEALERARKCLDEKRDTCFVRPDVIFPELKESEDERIRKDLIAIFKGKIPYTSEEDAKRYIAWLEKQGEQKQKWSDEDEKHLETLDTILLDDEKIDGKAYVEITRWLKSLKQRMEEQQ